MAQKTGLKEQRDRFLAFSFASADLFMEVDEGDIVLYALGAAKSLTGIDHTVLEGRNWLHIFTARDRVALATLRKKARDGERCGPLSVTIDEDMGTSRQAIVTGIQMPGSGKFYVTVGFPSELMERIAETIRDNIQKELLDKETFLYVAQEAFDMARSLGQSLDMTLVDIANTNEVRQRLGDSQWDQFVESLTSVLASYAVDGKTTAVIADGRYTVVHDQTVNSDIIREKIAALARESDPAGSGFEINSKTVTSDLESLSEREVMKALVYTIHEFERKGTMLNIDTLNHGFKAYVSANAQKVQQFKTMVQQMRFDFNFHPIVRLEDNVLSHFEMLSRFHDGGSTREWVTFAEDIHMAVDFDIAVCDRAINYLLYKSSGHGTKFSINLSGQSMQNEQFFKTLLAKLTLNKDLSNRMIFEITESTMITELDMVNHFIETLQGHGFKICLDDFGAGAASIQYLQNLHVDYVKIDGQYTQKVLASDRDMALVKNIARMCADLNIKVIAERIEKEDQAYRLKKMGIPLGQGYLYSPVTKKPEYNEENIKDYEMELNTEHSAKG